MRDLVIHWTVLQGLWSASNDPYRVTSATDTDVRWHWSSASALPAYSDIRHPPSSTCSPAWSGPHLVLYYYKYSTGALLSRSCQPWSLPLPFSLLVQYMNEYINWSNSGTWSSRATTRQVTAILLSSAGVSHVSTTRTKTISLWRTWRRQILWSTSPRCRSSPTTTSCRRTPLMATSTSTSTWPSTNNPAPRTATCSISRESSPLSSIYRHSHQWWGWFWFCVRFEADDDAMKPVEIRVWIRLPWDVM